MTNHKIYFGDSRDMKQLRDNSVQLIVTSPPYWQLKDYGEKNQIGFNDSYEEYINNLNLVWQECYRVLSNGCRMCINIGDQFARSVYYGRYKVIPIRTQIIQFCESLGMDYMGAIIWKKNTTMNTSGGGSIMGSYPYPRNGILKIDYEFILIFKKLGEAPKITKEQKLNSKLSKEEWNEYFSSHWCFNGVKQLEHIAMFPEELPKRLIKMFSYVGETILDPFLGSGTTSLVAMKLNRNSIGYEINENFKSTIDNKLREEIDSNCATIDYYQCKNQSYSLKTLPYIYNDPQKMNKKVDVKKFDFGSIIDKRVERKIDYYSVKKVLSPNTIIINTGLKIKLLGIEEKQGTEEKAIVFLEKLFDKHKIFLKYDTIMYDNNNTPLCYIYLENKTFVNKHLARTGFVSIDTSIDYKYKDKFLGELKNG